MTITITPTARQQARNAAEDAANALAAALDKMAYAETPEEMAKVGREFACLASAANQAARAAAAASREMAAARRYGPKVGDLRTLTTDITDPDQGTIATAGTQVKVTDTSEADENGYMVETLDGRHSFYADLSELQAE